MSILDYLCVAEAVNVVLLVTAVCWRIWRSDHPKDTRPVKLPHGRHEQPHHGAEKLAETVDIPMDDVEWFQSLRKPRKPAPALDLTRDVVLPPVYGPDCPPPKYEPAWRPIRRERLDPPSLKTSGPAMPDETPGGGPVAGSEPERPVPAVPDSAVSTAGTGLPPGEIAPWVLDTLRGTDSILDSIVARAGAR